MQPRGPILIGLALLLVLVLNLSCNPNPQPEGLTPVPTLAPASTLNLVTELQQPAATEGAAAPSTAPEDGDPTAGAVVFANCVPCHGENAQGGAIGPTLVSAEMKAKADDYYQTTITNGVTGTAMPTWSDRLSTQDINDVIAFLRSKQ